MTKFTPQGLARHFETLAATADAKILASERAIGDVVLEHARAIFGDEHLLAPLEPSTVEAKARRGAEDPNAPLIDTGALRDSLYVEVEGPLVAIGSDDPRMIYHELGTRKMPARPVLQLAVVEAEHDVRAIVRETAEALVSTKPRGQ